MAAALLANTSLTIRSAVAVGTHRPAVLPAMLTWLEASHPLPDERSVNAGRAAATLATVVKPDETLLLLLSGGASALAALPADGVSLAEKRQTIDLMMRSGADIHALNTVRKHLSAIKGGGLARTCRGTTITLAVSDVVGDDLSVIGSGPGVPDPSTWADAADALERFGGNRHPESVRVHVAAGLAGVVPDTLKASDADASRAVGHVIATQRDALAAARRAAEDRGYRTMVVPDAVTGEARDAAKDWFNALVPRLRSDREPLCVISAGETTVRVTGQGKGGRNQEFALALARTLSAESRDMVVASVGTDGIDGPTDAAGAVVDRTTLDRAAAKGLSPESILAANDSFTLFESLGDLIRTGRTDTNVGDLQILLASRT
jgi:glycerate 2-kinase